ncbi:hypothetical protein A2U01_0092876, partial [Trifolium medium]|nr:hypothetical protein [Trifolium medium]
WMQAFLREYGEEHSGGRRGGVELVELSKISMIVGSKRFFGSTERCTPGAEEGAMNLLGAT